MPKHFNFILPLLLSFFMALAACGNDLDKQTPAKETAKPKATNSTSLQGQKVTAPASLNATQPAANATQPAANATQPASGGATGLSPAEVSFPDGQANELLGVGFIYAAKLKDVGWAHQHDLARQQIEKLPHVVTAYVDNISNNVEAELALRSMAQKGYKLIVATAPEHKDVVKKVAADFPAVKFLLCSDDATASAPNISVFSGQMEQPRYLTGMVAGSMTKSNVIGYVAAFPVPEVIRGINAFTLGVKEVNPKAEVRVSWIDDWSNPLDERIAAEELIKTAGADVLAQHVDDPTVQEVAAEHNIYSVGYYGDMAVYAPKAQLTAAIWNWTPFYTAVLEKLAKGQWEEFSYNQGLKSGIVDIAPYGAMVPGKVLEKVNARKAQMIEGTFSVFQGPVLDQNKATRIQSGAKPSEADLMNMDWFVPGVIAPEKPPVKVGSSAGNSTGEGN